MSVNYLIQAQIIDIKQDNPKQDDVFLLIPMYGIGSLILVQV